MILAIPAITFCIDSLTAICWSLGYGEGVLEVDILELVVEVVVFLDHLIVF